MSTSSLVCAWDVDWIDIHGTARVRGFEIAQSQVRALVRADDRHATGRLTAQARERIARELSETWRPQADGDPAVIRDCDG